MLTFRWSEAARNPQFCGSYRKTRVGLAPITTMSRPKSLIPSYRLHKPSGQAVMTVSTNGGSRKTYYLGKHGSDESKAEYKRLVSEISVSRGHSVVTNGIAVDLTMNELILRFWDHATLHYRHPDGRPTTEIENYKLSLRPLRELYGHTRVHDFGPLALKVVRQRMIARGWCRTAINGRIGRIRRMFKWAASEELIPVAVFQSLGTVVGLQAGRSDAVEREPVKPVAEDVVDATLPFLNRHVAGLVMLQRFSGCRPGEACGIRRREVETTGVVWHYRPVHHKLAYRGRKRLIAIGPKAQTMLKEFFTPQLDDFLFSPARAVEEQRQARSAARQTPRYPSHMKRNAAKRLTAPQSVARDSYSVLAYGRAVAKAVCRANAKRLAEAARQGTEFKPFPHWHPNQLRHLYATKVRRDYGLEAAQVALGHSRAEVTQVYAERDEGLAVKVATLIG